MFSAPMYKNWSGITNIGIDEICVWDPAGVCLIFSSSLDLFMQFVVSLVFAWVFFYFLYFVDRASLYNLVNKAKLVHNFS